ncbi:hypothetical protein [uncultured Psychroserpens sp.]|uniref:hypothetical protein n=1 Tax=uncultured Psychroserpens sp. TaxID=255436 RepID=UPI0026265D04|nr:hypothetical protein [uncultured Psychroserpens sp.]
MMANLFYKNLVRCFIIVFSFSAVGQNKATKEIKSTHEFFSNGTLSLENKYGNVFIYGWDKESIDITVSIETQRKTQDDAKELLNRITSNITATNKQVIIRSEIEKKGKGFLNKYLSKIDPFKNDKTSTSINYTIYLPKSAAIEINNKYGDLIITDWDGKLDANVEHGDIRTIESISNSSISIKYGKLKARTLVQSKIESKDATINIDTSENLKINSVGSEIELDKIEQLELHSNKDNIEINTLNNGFGTIKYATVVINNLTKANLELYLAELRILNLATHTPSLNINQEISDVYINITNTNFDFSAQLEQGVLRIPKTMKNINSSMIDNKNKIRNIIATYGDGQKGTFVFTGLKGIIILKEL